MSIATHVASETTIPAPAEAAISQAVLRIFRGDASGGSEETYVVPIQTGMVVLDAVLYVQAHDAPDLAVRWNCKAAHCGSCSAEINGRPKLMCKTRLSDYGDKPIHVAPMKTFPLIKDLVTDVSFNYRVNAEIPAFSPSENGPFLMQQQDVERAQEFRKCIECFLCQDVCHVLREHDAHQRYYGPRYMARIAGLEMHPKDTASRLKLLRTKAGIGMCNITKCCESVCPEHIHLTDNAIIPLKERVADQYFDPVRWIIRTVTGQSSAKE